jgi:hypothetical protein
MKDNSSESLRARCCVEYVGAQPLVSGQRLRGQGYRGGGSVWSFFFRAKARSMLRGWTEMLS